MPGQTPGSQEASTSATQGRSSGSPFKIPGLPNRRGNVTLPFGCIIEIQSHARRQRCIHTRSKGRPLRKLRCIHGRPGNSWRQLWYSRAPPGQSANGAPSKDWYEPPTAAL